jgi:hypothetical protein
VEGIDHRTSLDAQHVASIALHAAGFLPVCSARPLVRSVNVPLACTITSSNRLSTAMRVVVVTPLRRRTNLNSG